MLIYHRHHHTYGEYLNLVNDFALALISFGITEMSAINIIGFNAPEWHMTFFGSIFGHYLPVGVYTTNNAEACYYVAEHSECELVVCDTQEQLKKYLSIWDRLPKLKAVVLYRDKLTIAVPANRKVY